jgi:putative endonuclease
MARWRQAVGAYGEQLAAQHLAAVGMVVLDRNWRCRRGEIDIVARDGDALVFCEVKTRRGEAYGPPAAAVVATKARRLRQLAALWLQAHPVRPDEVRFDVISIRPGPRGEPDVEHLRSAF